jgi:hypothetical protein
MRKIIFLITACTLMAYSVNAQDDPEELKIGVKAGINMSNIYNAQSEEFTADYKIGLAAGGFLSIPIGKFLGVQPEVLFSQKGFRASGTVLTYPYEFKRTTNFIDIPILIAFKPLPGVTLLAGPQYSYLVKKTDEYTGVINAVVVEEFENENFRRNILCFLGGADFSLSNLVLGARLGWDIQHNNGDGTSNTPRYKNVWYQATLGLKF